MSGATGVPQGEGTAAGQVSCAVPGVLVGSQQSTLSGDTGSQGLRWEDALGLAVLQWKLLQVPEQQFCCLWHESPHSQV